MDEASRLNLFYELVHNDIKFKWVKDTYYKKIKKGDNAFIFIIGQFNIWKSKGANNEL